MRVTAFKEIISQSSGFTGTNEISLVIASFDNWRIRVIFTGASTEISFSLAYIGERWSMLLSLDENGKRECSRKCFAPDERVNSTAMGEDDEGGGGER
jgi:hypothetical protein